MRKGQERRRPRGDEWLSPLYETKLISVESSGSYLSLYGMELFSVELSCSYTTCFSGKAAPAGSCETESDKEGTRRCRPVGAVIGAACWGEHVLTLEGEHAQACKGEQDQGQNFTAELGRRRGRASREEKYQHAHLCLRPLTQGGAQQEERGTGGNAWLVLLHKIGVLFGRPYCSCEACFGKGGDKEGVGRGVDDWVSSLLWGGATGRGEHGHCKKS